MWARSEVSAGPSAVLQRFKRSETPHHANAIWRKDGFSGIVTGNLPRIRDESRHDSPNACARRRYGGEFYDRDRSDDRIHRHAADRRPARWTAALQLGVRGVPSDADRHHRGVRQALRSRRPQESDAGRDRSLPLWLDFVRIRVVDAVADRLPAGSGHRRGRGPADRHDHRRRPLFGARARKDPGMAGERLGLVGSPWTTRRRPHHPVFFLGLDLLDEPADRRARRSRVLGLFARKASSWPRQDRSLKRRLFHRRHRRDHGRSHRAFDLGTSSKSGSRLWLRWLRSSCSFSRSGALRSR